MQTTSPLTGARIIRLESVESTNDHARKLEGHLDAVITRTQTRGRGQRGNDWISAPGENLTFSVVMHPRFLAAEKQFLLSQTVALALCDSMNEFGIHVQVKWTNDIYYGDSKLAGILIENDIRGANLWNSIIGIGLNVNQRAFDPLIPNPISMGSIKSRSYDTDEVFESIYSHLHSRFGILSGGGHEDILNEYSGKMYLRDIPHRFRLPDGSFFTGTIRGVRPTGELIVEKQDGETSEYLFREIEFTNKQPQR